MQIDFETAVHLLQKGEVVAMQTDTVYGLLGAFGSLEAIDAIYALKKRPKEKSLIVLFDQIETLMPYIEEIPPGGKELMQAFWPGPLTLILPANPFRCEAPTIAVRIPGAPLLRALIARVGPLVAPSANLSGYPPASSKEELEEIFSEALPILHSDTPPTEPSTILSYENGSWMITRKGAIDRIAIEAILPSLT